MTRPDPFVLDALRLRRWVLRHWGPTLPPPPSVSATGWDLFLSREACAARLKARLLPSQVPGPLAAAAEREAQVVLLLRAELGAVVSIATEIGLKPAVLKGGAVLHTPGMVVPAKDIDLLLPDDEAYRLLAALDAAGWHPTGKAPLERPADRARPGSPPVEIHPASVMDPRALDPAALARSAAHPQEPGLLLLSHPDQVRHLAVHQTIEHASHRGRLRDLLLLADAVGSAVPPPDLSRWSLTPQQASAVNSVIAMADALRRGVAVDDPFEELAVVWYAMERRRAAGSAGAGLTYARWVHDLVAGDDAASDRWATTWGTGPSIAGLAAWQLRVKRMIALPPIIAFAWWRAGHERRRARALRAHLDGVSEDDVKRLG